MMDRFQNFVYQQIALSITDTSDSILLFQPNWPGPSSQYPFNAPINPIPGRSKLLLTDSLTQPTRYEIISYLRNVPDSGNNEVNRLREVKRGLDGTTAQSWPVDTFVTSDLFAGDLAPLVLSSGSPRALAPVAGGGLGLRQVSIKELRGATPGNPIVLDAQSGPITAAALGEADIYYNASIGHKISVVFDNGNIQDIVTK